MAMSAEQRQAASDRMKARHAANKGNGHIADVKVDAVAPPAPVKPEFVFGIAVRVDWHKVPMQEARLAYAELQRQHELAGKILNARSMATFNDFNCFICKKNFQGMARYIDNSYKDPNTGLIYRDPATGQMGVQICGEVCLDAYQHKLFEKRRDDNQKLEEAR
jgi:hypothetical protein